MTAECLLKKQVGKIYITNRTREHAEELLTNLHKNHHFDSEILDFENYGSLPHTRNERRSLAKEIRRLVNQKFPDFVRKQKSCLRGIPGFWLDKCGNGQVWLERDYSCPMM